MDRQMMLMRMSRGGYVDQILVSLDDVDSAVADMDSKLNMKINSIKAVIKKFDVHNSIPNPDTLY